jgi:hypothetical protein
MTTLTSPHDLLAAVPFLIGYHPLNSLVVIALSDDAIGMAMRVDFPGEPALLAAHLVHQNAEAAIIVAYLPEGLASDDHTLAIQEAIKARGIDIKECIQVVGDKFRSTICADLLCCPLEGNQIPEISDSLIAAEQVALGKPLPFAGINAMRLSLSAEPRDLNLIRETTKIAEIDYQDPGAVLLQREGAHAVDKLLAEFMAKGICHDKELIALVLVRLLDLQVRDYAMGITTEENEKALWAMWRWLLRIAPRGFVAPVATLFATMTYERGDGALAQRALERAFEDDRNYQMAKLLRRTFAAGWPAHSFTQMRAELHPKICAALFE